jgi:hypothetical protein
MAITDLRRNLACGVNQKLWSAQAQENHIQTGQAQSTD